MATATSVQGTTFDDFCLLIEDGQKADLINGVIHMSSPDTTEANQLATWLSGLLDFFVEARELGQLFASRVAFRLAEDQAPEPDIAFVCNARLHLVRRGFVAVPPDLAVEIVSPDSMERDYVHKREQYRQAGVPEYWIVDPLRQRFTLLKRTASGMYRGSRPHRGVLHSQAVPGFWLRPAWLWRQPRPKKAVVLTEILGDKD